MWWRGGLPSLSNIFLDMQVGQPVKPGLQAGFIPEAVTLSDGLEDGSPGSCSCQNYAIGQEHGKRERALVELSYQGFCQGRVIYFGAMQHPGDTAGGFLVKITHWATCKSIHYTWNRQVVS